MLISIAIYTVVLYVVIIALGTQQTGEASDIPTNRSRPQGSVSDIAGILAVSAICLQAFVSAALLSGSAWFQASVFLAWRSRFGGETCSCAPFQLKDVSNHETWVVAALIAALVSWLRV
jgi:hypothetical protein